MRLPDGSAVKRVQRFCARLHVVESAQPDELIWVIEITELTDHLNPNSFLGFHEFTVEELDQVVAFSRVKCVLSKFDDGGVCLCFHVLFLFATEAQSRGDFFKRSL